MSNLPLKRLTYYPQKRFFTSKSLQNHAPRTKTTNVTKLDTDIEKLDPFSSSFTVQYLVNSCGLSLKSAISASKRVELIEKNKTQYDFVVSFLKSNEFSDTHVAKFVKKRPAVLFSRVSANLEPKIRFLTQNGLPGSLVPKLFLSIPNILFRSLDAQLKPVMELLRDYVGCDEKIAVSIDRGSWIFNCDVNKTLRPNVEFLVKQGVPKERVGYLLATQPRCLYWTDVDRMVDAVKMVGSMGVKPSETVFIYALRVILSMSDLSWKRKVGVFESLGWTYDEVITTFVRNPLCLSLSEKKLRDSMDFMVNTVKIDPKIIIGYPKILAYSLEKRIVPRYTILKILKERNLIPDTQFVWQLNKSDKAFVHGYITRFSDEIPHLQSIYNHRKKLGRISA